MTLFIFIITVIVFGLMMLHPLRMALDLRRLNKKHYKDLNDYLDKIHKRNEEILNELKPND